MKRRKHISVRERFRLIIALLKKILNYFSIKSVTNHIAKLSFWRYIAVIISLSLIGIGLNISADNPLPCFYELLLLLAFCQISTFCTTMRIISMQRKLNNDDMTGSSDLLVLRVKFNSRLTSNLIYIPTVIFGIVIPTATFRLINIEIDNLVIAFCFICLSVVTMSCTIGAVYYFYVLMFIQNLKKNVHKIKCGYDSVKDHIKWINDIISVSRMCNIFFLLVGTAFILAFCLFSFSGKFCINYKDAISKICLAIFWAVITICIILGAIISAIWSKSTIRKIIDIIFLTTQKNLYEEFLIAKSLDMKIEHGIRLSLLSTNRNQIIKQKKSIFAVLISIINIIASFEAAISLADMLIGINIPLLISKIELL